MIQNFKLQKKFREEVIAESPQPLTDMEIGQRVMMKMQQHMMKNGPPGGPGGHGPPGPQGSPEHQKIIQLQILEHLSKDIAAFPEK